MDKKQILGGQAVIEGVMMKNKDKIAISVRLENNKIISTTKRVKFPSNFFFKLPFIRGIINLFIMLYYGMYSLTWSANQIIDEEGNQQSLDWFSLTGVLLSSLFFSLFLFVFLPYLFSEFFIKESLNPFLFNLLDSFIKIIFFIIYILVISYMDDIKRLFQYHGAEHKTVSCNEKGLELTIENCKKQSRLHPRCGTSFIMLVFLIGILLFSIVPYFYFSFSFFQSLNYWIQKTILFFSRLLMLPLVASFSYELLLFSSKHLENPFIKIFIYPGLALQLLTTKEPDEKQLEVAIHSLKLVK